MKTNWAQVRGQWAALASRFRRFGENDNEVSRWFGWGPVSWCAETVSYMFWLACHANGEPSPFEHTQTDKGTAYSGHFIEWARAGQHGLRFSPEPAVGAIVVYDWGDGGMTDHVGMVDSIQGGSKVAFTAWEGNTGSDSVQLVSRNNRSGYVVGFAIPAWGAGGGSNPPPNTPAWPGRVLSLTTPLTTGGDVRAFQQRMFDRGWKTTPQLSDRVPGAIRWTLGVLGYRPGQPFTVDGAFGAQTTAVVAMFQLEKGLVVDSQVGPLTWQTAFRGDNVT